MCVCVSVRVCPSVIATVCQNTSERVCARAPARVRMCWYIAHDACGNHWLTGRQVCCRRRQRRCASTGGTHIQAAKELSRLALREGSVRTMGTCCHVVGAPLTQNGVFNFPHPPPHNTDTHTQGHIHMRAHKRAKRHRHTRARAYTSAHQRTRASHAGQRVQQPCAAQQQRIRAQAEVKCHQGLFVGLQHAWGGHDDVLASCLDTSHGLPQALRSSQAMAKVASQGMPCVLNQDCVCSECGRMCYPNSSRSLPQALRGPQAVWWVAGQRLRLRSRHARSQRVGIPPLDARMG